MADNEQVEEDLKGEKCAQEHPKDELKVQKSEQALGTPSLVENRLLGNRCGLVEEAALRQGDAKQQPQARDTDDKIVIALQARTNEKGESGPNRSAWT